eukprot:COSAG06_NODE_579_length_14027_cov_2.460942_5_plen_3130_part_00
MTHACGRHRRHLSLLLPLLLGAPLASGQDAACAFDFTLDGIVGTNDLLYLLASFGRTSVIADTNGDGIVGTDDLLGLLAVYGRSCDPDAPAPPVASPDCDGVWGDWAACSEPCGGGIQSRTYTATAGTCATENGSTDAQPCNTEIMCPEAAAALFAEAMLDVDPFGPLVAVASSISFGGDITLINADQMARQVFEQSFATAMAASLGDGSTVSPEVVIVDEIREIEADWEAVGRRRLQSLDTPEPESIEILFHLLLPESLQSAGSSLVAMMQESDQQIEITVAGVTFVADAASMAPPTILPAVVNCEGAWIPSEDECSEPCGPSGVRPQNFVVIRAEQNGGSNCIEAETLPEPLPCNTHVQCPVDCAGEWGQWGDCSVPCGNGTQTRIFVVSTEPQHGGAECPEHDTSQAQVCNPEPCPPPAPQAVDCVGSWSGYGECSHTCGVDGLHQRTFTISQVASNGGTACAYEAGAVESQSCNTEIQCPIDCEGTWTDFGTCSEVCGPGTRTRQFQITEDAQYGGICPEAGSVESEECDNLCPVGLDETDVSPGPITLPVSGAFQLATLVKLPEGETALLRASAIPVARSYNGNNWEGTMPSPAYFTCTDAPPVACSTTLPAGATYQLRTYDGTTLVSQDPKIIASRFLTQAAFGPTLDEIDLLSAATVEEPETAMEDWLIAQMEMEPSLHRAYLRRRINTQVYNNPAVMVRDPCSETSSWVTFAFSKFDQGKLVDVSLNADGSYSLSIDGIVRTVVESTKDIREDIGWSCYKRGFRTPLDMPGTSPTDEVSVEACHERCVSTDGCGYFSFDEDNMECHLQAPSASALAGNGGPWRSGPVDCSDSEYIYPPLDPGAYGLENMGGSCWGGRNNLPRCWHGSCPTMCGENGFCCRFGRNAGGCRVTDPSITSHECVPDPNMAPPPPSPAPRLQANTSYVLCFVTEYEGGDVSLLVPGVDYPGMDWRWGSCVKGPTEQIIIGNPPVSLREPDMFITQQLDGIDMVPMPIPLRDSYSLRNIVENCELPPNPTVFIYHGERYYRHEPRSQLVDNTVDGPHIEDRITYQGFCPAAGRTFTNADGCVRLNSCSTPSWTEGTVTLNDDLMQQLFAKSQKYVYVLTNYSLDGFSDDEISACSVRTRWKKTTGSACDMDTPLGAATLTSLSAALQPQPNQTEVVLETPDVIIIEAVQGECTTELNGTSIVGAKVTLDGTCYEQIHPDELNVVDMAYWMHRIDRYGGGILPLTRPAMLGETELDMQSVCTTIRTREQPTCYSSSLRRQLGVLGQEIEFSSLPTTVQVPWLAEFAGAEDVSVDPGVSLSCGSQGEVANDPALGHKYGDRREFPQKPTHRDKEMLWPNVIVHAQDQLRQRVAWALSQMYVVSGPGGYEGNSESVPNFYDILVRNAFGNFRSFIKELVFSEPMSVMLTYRDSKSAAYSGDFADENFARESIQLFTVGTEHLNSDGTPVLDADGNLMHTYGVKDVASFARTWTGFVPNQGGRTNTRPHIDELKIVPKYRDASPKMDLYDGFIGDGYPMCVDLPKYPFLRKGFSYAYRGDSVDDLNSLKDDDGVLAFVEFEDPNSSLFQALCVPVEGACTFPLEVTLAQSLPCSGAECDMDRAPLVRVIDGTGTDAYYEAVEFACTRFPFFNDGQFIKYGAPYENKMSCADPRSDAAAPLCCSDDATDGTGVARCSYHRERVTYATAASRCEMQGQDVCQGSAQVNNWNTCHPYSRWRFSTWMGRTCSTKVQIQRDGRVSAVHAGDLVDNSALSSRIQPETVADVLSVNSKSVFDVLWREDSYPKAAENCSSSCTVLGGTCLCDVVASTSAVFADTQSIPTASEVKELPIGALDPTAYDEGEYARCTSALCSAADVQVWTRRYRMHEALGLDIEEVNVALNKPTSASSNHQGRQDSWITDGSTETGYYSTTQAANQFVQVDLEAATNIDSVRIYFNPGATCNRNCQRHVTGASIVISDTPDFSTGTQCGDDLTWASPYRINLCDGISGRYVTVRNSPTTRVLQIVELEVLAEAILTPDGYVYAPLFYDFIDSSSDELVYTEDTIFEVTIEDTGASKFFKNQELRVSVDDNSFRNPPTLIDYDHPTLRQAKLETDAVLDHLTTHVTTAPHVCKKLIQFLTSSNPSPRYVLEVVTAFRTGEYGGRVYSGEYGDLGATVAAILMDREARDLTLDLDPMAGKIREPMVKLWHAIRSLEFVANRNQEIEMPDLMSQIGQQHHRAATVFGFFEPDFSPAGAVAKASLFAPEAELLTAPNIIGYMNGMAALVDKGLSGCSGGFGYNIPRANPHLAMPRNCGGEAAKITADGRLTYEYQIDENRAGDVVSELALLLTSGREPPAVRALWDESQTQYVNVAVNRPTNSSSGFPAIPASVVDGLIDSGLFLSSQCSGEQFVQVDLLDTIDIAKVKFYHRMEGGEQINGATVLVSDTPDFTTGVQCAAPLVFTGDPVATLTCPGTFGRYVTVRQEGPACLQLVELQVLAVRSGTIGEPTCSVPGPPPSFTAHPNEACAGRNELGLSNHGTLEGCYQHCLATPGCIAVESRIADPGDCQFSTTCTCPGYCIDTAAWNMYSFEGTLDSPAEPADPDEAATCNAFALAPPLEDCTPTFVVNNNRGCSGRNEICSHSAPPCSDANTMEECQALCTADDNCVSFEFSGDRCQMSSTCDVRVSMHSQGWNLVTKDFAACSECAAAGCSYTPRYPTTPVPSEADLLPDLIKLFTFSSEYSATNLNVLRDHPRPAPPPTPSQNRPYKAIVVILLLGGADSWNMLMPHSGCVRDLYAEYAEARSTMAMPLADLLPIDLHEDSQPQPCTTYGMHPAQGKVKELFDAGQASWFANIGTLTEPITRDDFYRGNRPYGLFSHTTQGKVIQSMHPQNKQATGVLGRIVDALKAQDNPYRTNVYTMRGMLKIIQGETTPNVVGGGGVQRFGQFDRHGLTLEAMTGSESDSVFADSYAAALEATLTSTERLGTAMANVELQGHYSGSTGMEQIARVMGLDYSLHESERDVFVVGIRSFDAHNSAGGFGGLLGRVDEDLSALHTDLTAMNRWNATTIISMSDFGRTISTNGRGTDHAWAGNMFMVVSLVDTPSSHPSIHSSSKKKSIPIGDLSGLSCVFTQHTTVCLV